MPNPYPVHDAEDERRERATEAWQNWRWVRERYIADGPGATAFERALIATLDAADVSETEDTLP